MSLHKFAEQVAANGRGEDSLLVHMTPDEVRNLQKFAQANGTTLTINPTTGLPEAGMLSDLFKTIAPIALGAFLGPAGLAMGGGFLTAAQAGLAVGGIATLATGSLSRGLMAGLGAYGGAGLGESLMGAGTGALEAGAAAAAQGQLGATNLALGEAMPAQVAQQFTQDATARQLAAATPFDKLGAGFSAATASPSAMGSFAKDNLKYLAAAASPIMADMMTPTTTKMPEMGNTGYIRQKVYDPYTQSYTSMAPVKANEWGARQFSDIHRGYNGGGIVALAHGGVPGFADGGFTDAQVKDWFLANQGASDATIANAMGQFKVGTDQIARATGTQGREDEYNTRFVQQVAQPDTTSAQFLAKTADVGLQNQDLANALGSSGLSAAAQYALTNTLGGTAGTQGGLAGLSQNINAALTSNPNSTLADARAQMDKYSISDADVLRATGKSTTDLFADRDAATKATADQAAITSKAAADKAAADKAAAEKANADRIAAAIAADEKAAAERAAAAKAINDARLKKIADEDAAGKIKGAADKAAYEKYIADEAAAKAAAEKAAREKAIADKAAADKIAAEKAAAAAAAAKAIADKAAADAVIAAKIAADKAAADALAAAILEGKTRAEGIAASDKARREAEAIAKAAADKIAADKAAAANTISTIGTVNLLTDTGVTQDTRDTTTTGTNTLATTTPGSITSNITTDGQYIGTTGATPAVGTKVGTGTISGTGTETTTGTTGPIIDYGGTPGFTVAPLTLAQTQIAQQAADLTAAQNKQLDLYRGFVTQNPNATDVEHANFLDKINLSPDVASRATPLSAQQMKNRYYDAKYNKMTGDSQSAYNFLMGKGAYPTKSGVGEIARPYSEATLGMPASTNKKYIFDPTTRSYKLNQDYVGTTRDSTGAVNYTMSPKDIYNYFVKNASQPDSVTYDWAIENGISPEQIAASTGVPLSTVAAKWRDAKAKKDSAAKTTADAAAAAGKTSTNTQQGGDGGSSGDGGGGDGGGGASGGGGGGAMAAGGITFAMGGMPMYAVGGGLGSLGSYSDGGRLLRGPGDGVSDSIPATIGRKQQPARLADGEFVVPARIVSELGNGSTEAGAKKLYAMMDRVQRARGKTTGKDKVAANSRADKYLPA